MTLDEAIKHCEDVAEDRCGCAKDCVEEHRQLAEWLKELKERRAKDEPQTDCETCRHWWVSEEVCLLDDCKYEPKTEPTRSKMEQVDKDTNVLVKDCETCNYENCDKCFMCSHYEPKDEHSGEVTEMVGHRRKGASDDQILLR